MVLWFEMITARRRRIDRIPPCGEKPENGLRATQYSPSHSPSTVSIVVRTELEEEFLVARPVGSEETSASNKDRAKNRRTRLVRRQHADSGVVQTATTTHHDITILLLLLLLLLGLE